MVTAFELVDVAAVVVPLAPPAANAVDVTATVEAATDVEAIVVALAADVALTTAAVVVVRAVVVSELVAGGGVPGDWSESELGNWRRDVRTHTIHTHTNSPRRTHTKRTQLRCGETHTDRHQLWIGLRTKRSGCIIACRRNGDGSRGGPVPA